MIHPTMFEEVPTRPSPSSRSGPCYIAANGGKVPNMGEKHVKFRTKEGTMSSVLFQVTKARKPFASVSKIVQKGTKVVFTPDGGYIENIATGKRIKLAEDHGTCLMDVDFIAEGFDRQA